jgi:pSer/pThr/pTyr-binding forkhead associated (FHA) protein
MPRIILSLPDQPDQAYELTDEQITLGRESDNSIPLEADGVSGHHLEMLARSETEYGVRDVGSTNGTKLNGKRLVAGEEVLLSHGDLLEFGTASIRFESEDGAEGDSLPETETAAARPALHSIKPSNFMNESPFQKKTKQADPIGTTLMCVCVLAILAALAAFGLIGQMQAPQ